MLRHFIQLTKPGIIVGNLVSVIGGFSLASNDKVFLFLLLMTVLGVSLVIASGCVFNNYIDQDIDRKMERTQDRVLVQTSLPAHWVLSYGTLLGIIGFGILFFAVNPLSAYLSLFGFIVYVGLYSLYFKRHSVHGTFVGSFSGAMPPVIGYCAFSQQLDLAAVILLLMFCFWQVVHSYAIAIFRLNDYRAADIPVLPVVSGFAVTRRHMLFYTIAFMIVSAGLTLFHYTGYLYFVITLLMNIVWYMMILRRENNEQQWARRIFIFSIIIVVVFAMLMGIDSHSSYVVG